MGWGLKDVLLFTSTFDKSDFFDEVSISHLIKKDKENKKVSQNYHVLVKLNILIWH